MTRSRNASPVRHGAVAVKAAVCMPVLLTIVALVVDGGLLFDKRRQSQSAADAAALAAAGDLFTTYTDGYGSNDGKDDASGSIAAHAVAVAAANGFPNDGVEGSVTVNIPPKEGPYAGLPGYVEVIISYNQGRTFSSVLGRDKLVVGARAVARGRWMPAGMGILCLDPTGAKALTVSGYAQGQVPNAAVIVNSNHAQAAYGEGSNATLTAYSFEFTGGYYQSANTFAGPIRTGVPPTPDPYRDLPQPTTAGRPVIRQSDLTTTDTGLGYYVDHGGGYKTYYLVPGVYDGGILFDGKSSVRMSPGIYYMLGNSQRGGFKFRGSSDVSLVADRVMLFNDRGTNTQTNPTSSDYPQISISGQASVQWTPPADGLYKGLSFFQARGQDMTIYIAGQGAMRIQGAYYAPDALIDIAGNGINYIGNQFVCWRMHMRGNGTYIVPWDPGTIQPIRDLKLVE